MRLLFDTHLLLWIAYDSARVPKACRALLDDPEHTLLFSAASIWEVAVKQTKSRADFTADATLLRSELLEADYLEVLISGRQAAAVSALPPIHADAFDRLLMAQALTEGLTLVTSDSRLARYPGPIRLV